MRRWLLLLLLCAAPTWAQVEVKFADRASGAFNRFRVAEPEDLFSVSFQYDLAPLLMRTTLATNGTVTHTAARSSATLAVTAEAGSSARFESRPYIRYLPGRSQLIAITGQLGAAVAGVTRTLGYFDADDGIFFKQNTTGLYWCLRTSTSGSPVDTCVEQASWNRDTLVRPNSGAGITLDITKAQIWVMDFQWLGNGRVRVGFDIDGDIVYTHEFRTANLANGPYMKTANLPIAWAISSDGTSTGTMIATCVDVMSEGGFHFDRGYQWSASTAAAGIAVTTNTPVIALRVADNMPQGSSIPNEAVAYLQQFAGLVTSSSDTVQFKLVYGATLDNTGWAAVNATHSGMEVSTTTGYTASSGVIIASGHISSGTPAQGASPVARTMATKMPLVRYGFGTVNSANRGNVVLLATAADGAATVAGKIQWTEIR